MGNNAIFVNPSNADITITQRGSDFLWAWFAVMTIVDLVVLAWTFQILKGRRAFHHLSAIILTTTAIAYFSMASNLGQDPVQTIFNGAGRTRAIWFARYIDWTITFPCLILLVLLASALPLSDIVATVFWSIVFTVSLLIGAHVVSRYKFGYLAFACCAIIYVCFMLLGPGRKSSGSLGLEYRSVYTRSVFWLCFIWMLYPICWGLSEGGNRISPDSEMVFYGILDLLIKPVFILFHLWQVSRLDYTKMQLQSSKASDGATFENRNDGELNKMHNINTKNRLADANVPGAGTGQPRVSEAATVVGPHSHV